MFPLILIPPIWEVERSIPNSENRTSMRPLLQNRNQILASFPSRDAEPLSGSAFTLVSIYLALRKLKPHFFRIKLRRSKAIAHLRT